MSWKVSTEPASEPFTKTDVKLDMKVDTTADDDLIDILIKAARQWVENHCRIGLLEQTITEVYDDWPSDRVFSLSVSPIRSVSGIYYKDSNGDTQTLSSALYTVDTFTRPARVQIKYSQTWPTLYDEINSVSAVYVVGYDAASAIPAPIRKAMLLTIADMYDNRQDHVKRLPTAAEYLLQSGGYRIWEF